MLYPSLLLLVDQNYQDTHDNFYGHRKSVENPEHLEVWGSQKKPGSKHPQRKKNIPFNLWGVSCSSSVSSPREKVWIWNIQDKLGYFSIHFTLCLRKVFAKKERWNCHVYDPIELILTPQPDFEPMRLCWKNEPNRSKNVDFTASSLRMEIFFLSRECWHFHV